MLSSTYTMDESTAEAAEPGRTDTGVRSRSAAMLLSVCAMLSSRLLFFPYAPNAFRAAGSILCAVSCAAGAVTAQAQVSLVPYLAVYILELRHDPASNSSMAALKGHLEVRIEQSCEGWDAQQSLGFRMLGKDGAELEHLAHQRSFEDKGGDFTFRLRAVGRTAY
jgi:hypothetical protein